MVVRYPASLWPPLGPRPLLGNRRHHPLVPPKACGTPVLIHTQADWWLSSPAPGVQGPANGDVILAARRGLPEGGVSQRRTLDRSQAPGTGRSYFTDEETEAQELKPALGRQLASGSLLPCNSSPRPDVPSEGTVS